jgi:hypothetical protein
MERETRNEVILPRREPGEADACSADEARFLRNDLNVAEGTQDVDESPGEVHDRWIGASKEGLEREASTRMPQILRYEAGTTPWEIHTGGCERGTAALYSSRDVIPTLPGARPPMNKSRAATMMPRRPANVGNVSEHETRSCVSQACEKWFQLR